MNVKFKDENMIVLWNREEFPEKVTKSIFLAGPTPRIDKSLSWRKEALAFLEKFGYNGIVVIPEEKEKAFRVENVDIQTDWEFQMMSAVDCIVFWVPRQLRPDFEMIALTTNAEFGRFLETGKLVVGGPPDAERNRYLKYLSQGRYEWQDSLEDLMKKAVEFVGDGVERKGAERFVPSYIFNSVQFQNWYRSQLKSGNELVDYQTLYSFYMPIHKKLFMAIWKPSVWIKKEDRVKEIEFVVGRTDMSYILAYYSGNSLMETEIVLIEEFRTPAVNEDSMIFELPGGSSLKETDSWQEVASEELKEETGIVLNPSRFHQEDIKQSAGTLCSHRIALFSVELTEDEIAKAKADKEIHGNVQDTERTYVHVMTVKDALKKVDWTNAGMILDALSKKSIE